MLLQAMNKFQVAKRDYSEAKKAQYVDKTGTDGSQSFFRASSMGSADRKIIYSFFKHQIPCIPRTAKSLRIFENGDYVHDRYQTAWEDMGALISKEERLSSKDDEYLKQFPWEWTGHHDGVLDMRILKAHALGKCTVGMAKDESDQWEMQIEIDDAYAEEIGIFKEDYEPLIMVADIKTMNPWGFKRLQKGEIGEIQGYIDQIAYYMYMKNTPYGSIFVEDKGSNDALEIQIVWSDLHEGVLYEFESEIHGEQVDGILRLTIDNERFFGSETVLGLVPRISRLWDTKIALDKASSSGDITSIEKLVPPRCSEDPAKFPCSWGGGKEKCEFFDHCWHPVHGGLAIKGYEDCPPEAVWEVCISQNELGAIDVIKIDSRKLPKGMTLEMFVGLLESGAIKYELFILDEGTKSITEAIETAHNADHLFNSTGELNLAHKAPSEDLILGQAEALEYTNANGEKAIKCLNCTREIEYKRLGAGGVKRCPFCSHVNKVIK